MGALVTKKVGFVGKNEEVAVGDVGSRVGVIVGEIVGFLVGVVLEEKLGEQVGFRLGFLVGTCVGGREGITEGFIVGIDGEKVGLKDGTIDGIRVVGLFVGSIVGYKLSNVALHAEEQLLLGTLVVKKPLNLI